MTIKLLPIEDCRECTMCEVYIHLVDTNAKKYWCADRDVVIEYPNDISKGCTLETRPRRED